MKQSKKLLVFGILAVGILGLIASSPTIYALVEPHITITMEPAQTTKPFQINDDQGTEVFSVDVDGTIFPSSGVTSKIILGAISEGSTLSAGQTSCAAPFQSLDISCSSDNGFVTPTTMTAKVLRFGADSSTLTAPITITLQLNTIDTSLVLIVPAGASTAEVTGSVLITKGDAIRFQAIASAGTGSVNDAFTISMESEA